MNNITVGYVRVSSKEQNEQRQVEELRAEGVDERYIYIEKKSGKDFVNREKYQQMVDNLREGDLLIVSSIDRLGRDYTEILEQWRHITMTLKADVKVLDMPLLDTRANPQTLDSRFIADLVLQILSYVANKERESIRKRQRQGIDVMPVINGKKVSTKTGRPTGRPNIQKPEQWPEIYLQWVNKQITAVAAMKVLGLKVNTFYSFVAQEREKV